MFSGGRLPTGPAGCIPELGGTACCRPIFGLRRHFLPENHIFVPLRLCCSIPRFFGVPVVQPPSQSISDLLRLSNHLARLTVLDSGCKYACDGEVMKRLAKTGHKGFSKALISGAALFVSACCL